MRLFKSPTTAALVLEMRFSAASLATRTVKRNAYIVAILCLDKIVTRRTDSPNYTSHFRIQVLSVYTDTQETVINNRFIKAL